MHSVDIDISLCWIPEPCYKISKGTLTGSTGADKGDDLTWFDIHIAKDTSPAITAGDVAIGMKKKVKQRVQNKSLSD